ncbi:MAG: hypothetical protein IJ569_07860 [Prevotella sp.]|nr:hypothetical protein [Prevotella sp.]
MASGDAAAGGEETADDTGDVTTDVEVLRIVDTDTLYAKAASNVWLSFTLSPGFPKGKQRECDGKRQGVRSPGLGLLSYLCSQIANVWKIGL